MNVATSILLSLMFLFVQNPDYKLDLGEHYESEKHEMPQGYVDAYTVLDAEGNQEYVLSITKVMMPDAPTMPDVYGEFYKNAILSKCGCSIESTTVKNYEHFTAQEFKLLRNGKTTPRSSRHVASML